MVSTCLRLCPFVITKASVIDKTSPPSRTTVFSAFLAEAAPDRHEALCHPGRRPDGAGAVEDLHPDTTRGNARQELAHELVEVTLAYAVHLVGARAPVDRLDREDLVVDAPRRQLAHDA